MSRCAQRHMLLGSHSPGGAVRLSSGLARAELRVCTGGGLWGRGHVFSQRGLCLDAAGILV